MSIPRNPVGSYSTVCVCVCRREEGGEEVEVCPVKKGAAKALKSSGRRSSSGTKQPSIADMFSRG